MAIERQLREEAVRHLSANESLQEVMWGTSIRPLMLYTGMWVFAPPNSYRAVVCTNRRLLLFEGGILGATFERLLESVDRSCRLGPTHGILYSRVAAFESPVYLSRRFFRAVRRADALVDCH